MSSDFRQTITEPKPCERTTCQLTFSFTDAAGVLIDVGPSTVTLTLYDKASGTILNGRSQQDIFDVNGGTIAGSSLTLELSAADNALVNQASSREEHIALIEYTWASGTKYGKKEVTFTVLNQRMVS